MHAVDPGMLADVVPAMAVVLTQAVEPYRRSSYVRTHMIEQAQVRRRVLVVMEVKSWTGIKYGHDCIRIASDHINERLLRYLRRLNTKKISSFGYIFFTKDN
jgi:uncharacterized protein with PIN domain